MDVLMITSDANILTEGSGAQSHVKELSGLTNRLMVVVINGPGTFSKPQKVNSRLWVFPTNSWIPLLGIFDVLHVVKNELYFQKRLQADLIVTTDVTLAGLAGTTLSSIYKKPVHMHVDHDVFSSSYLWASILHAFRYVFARIVIGRASTTTVGNERTRQSLVSIDPKFGDRTTVVHPFMDVDSIQAEKDGPEHDLHIKYTTFEDIILAVGPLVRQQNFKVAIRSLAELLKTHKQTGLVIVGNGPGKLALKLYAISLGVSRRVKFEPMRDNLRPYLRSTFLLMVPAYYEPYDMLLEQAAAAGTAIITSPIGIAPDIIINRQSGFLCDPHNPPEFWGAADLLIRNPQMRDTFKQNIALSLRNYMIKDKSEQLLLYKAAWEGSLRVARGIDA